MSSVHSDMATTHGCIPFDLINREGTERMIEINHRPTTRDYCSIEKGSFVRSFVLSSFLPSHRIQSSLRVNVYFYRLIPTIEEDETINQYGHLIRSKHKADQ